MDSLLLVRETPKARFLAVPVSMDERGWASVRYPWGRVSGGELGGNGLAQHYSAGLLKASYRGGVVGGDKVGVDLGAGGGLHSGGIVYVLDAYRDAVEGAAGALGIELPVKMCRRLRYRGLIYGYPGFERRLQLIDAPQKAFHQRYG